MHDKFKITVFFILVFSGVGLRLLCRDIPNFAPVAALALYSGFFFRNSWFAALIPISVLTITNLYLGGYESWVVMLSVYACLILPVLFGKKLLSQKVDGQFSVPTVMGLTLFGSLLFFFVTNYASWLYWYPKTVSGFVECYMAAIPFFRFTLMGDFFFCFVFFSAHALATRFVSSNATAPLKLEQS